MTTRNTSPLLILFGFAALSAVGALFFLLAKESSVAPEVSSAPAVEAASADTVQPLLAVDEHADEELAQVESVEGDSRAAVVAEEVEKEPKIAEEDLVWVEGRVVLAAGTPSDEEVRVLSLDRARSLQQLYNEGGPADAAWDASLVSARLLDHATMDEDGRFRIQASKKFGSAILALSGRYSFCRASRSFPLSTDGEVVLTAELGAWISGRVVAAPGTPELELEGTEVGIGPDVTASFNTLEISRSAFSKEVECDAQGNFEFRSMPSTMTFGVVAKHDARAARIDFGLRPSPGEHLVHDMALSQGATLAGHVLDEAGEPLADVEVVARLAGPIGRGIGALRKSRTGEDGSFTLTAVYPGRVELNCSPKGHRDGKLRVSEELAEGVSIDGLVLTVPGGSSVSGRVTFLDGALADGARVSASADFSQMDPSMMGGGIDTSDSGFTETDEEGDFVIGGLGDGPFVVSASLELEEGEHAGEWRGSTQGVSGGTTDLLIVMEGVTTLRGRVVGLDDLPIADFDVAASLKGSGAMFGIGAERVSRGFKEREDGSFELTGLRAGTWEVVVGAENYGATDPIEVELPESEDATPLVFVLEPASVVSGSVVDMFGKELSGARVSIEASLADRMKNAMGGAAPEAFTDFEGKFVLAGLDPGPCELVAQLEGFASSEPVSLELVSGERTEDVVLQLRVGGLLTGEILDDEGEPAAGRSVIVQRMPTYNRQYMMSSDARGEFRFEHLEPGQWQVISMPNVMTGEVESDPSKGMGDMLSNMEMAVADIVDGESTHLILGQPPEDPVKLTGVVLHAGEPVPNAVVSLVPEGAEGLGDLNMAFTDEEGKFEIDLDKRGDYLVTVQNNVGTGRQNSIEFGERIPEEGEEHHVSFDLPLGRISGRVKDADGAPAASCRITLNVEGGVAYGSFLGGHYAELTTDEQGEYDIPYLRPGTYTLSAGGAMLGGMLGDDGTTTGRAIQSGLRVGDGEWLSGVDFELARPGVLVGHVKDSAGLPVSGASVWVRDEAGNVLERFALVETDGGGKFTYKGLGPGTYSLFAKKGTEVSQPSAPTRLAEGGRAEATVTLDAGTMLLVTVVDKTEAEVRARISVTDSEGNEMSGLYSLTEIMSQFGEGFSAKVQRVGPLPAGKYRVSASLDDGRKTHKNVNLGSRAERKIKLRLK